MPAPGGFKWMNDPAPGPRPNAPKWQNNLPKFEPDTARAPMGVRPAPFRHSNASKAVRARRQRESAKPAYPIVRSQLNIAKKRPESMQNPCRSELLARFASKSRDYSVGDEVLFIGPGGRRIANPVKAVVLAFPDKAQKYVAVDRSRHERRGAHLQHIDVVLREDVWLP